MSYFALVAAKETGANAVADGERAHPVVFQFEQPIGAIEWVLRNFCQAQWKRGGI